MEKPPVSSVPSATGTAPWIRISEASQHLGETVEIRGWVSQLRSSGKVQFLVLRDGSGLMQCVAGVRDLSPEAHREPMVEPCQD